ncbi:Ig-like domain-containing protein [Tamlana sp. I1]|uniref:Ig-like domain-containing protein n=1 Tax=Tamlana sp. I1 TaxID=2762061 RepID=UPI00188FFB39|nr:Ig-like domain-containing protein [Tamlana sp. I1]
MIKIKFLLITLFCAVFTLTGCSSEDSTDDSDNGGGNENPATGITLDKSTLDIDEGETATLTATLEPLDAEGTITWSSSNAAVATVDSEGVVTAIKEGEAAIVAAIGTLTAICDVTVTKETVIVDSETLKGSDYYIIQLDETSYNSISTKVINDFRPDGVDKNLYIWENTFNGGTSTGPNFYGLDQGWISFTVANVGWSGAGFSIGPNYGDIDMTRMFDNPEDYYLHIGLKTGQAASSYLFILTDGQAEAKIAIGDNFVDDGTTYQAFSQLTRDNTWNSIDIPVTHLNELGLFFNQPFSDVNILALLAGGTQGTTFDMDAVFFYKKNK